MRRGDLYYAVYSEVIAANISKRRRLSLVRELYEMGGKGASDEPDADDLATAKRVRAVLDAARGQR